MVFNGANIAEIIDISANGGRVRFTRNIATVTMDLNDVEQIDFNALGGADNITVNDLSGTAVVAVILSMAGAGAGGDVAADVVIVNGTNGADSVQVLGSGANYSVAGLAAQVNVQNSEGANDQLILNTLAGNDAVSAATLPAGIVKLTLDGDAGNDQLTGSQGNDVLLGGADNDTLIGGDGDDQVFGGSGNDRMIWNPGDDTDLNEGGSGVDTVEVNGGNGTEVFSVTANGTRVRFDRITPAPFSIDIGTSENLVLNMNGGTDTFTGSNGLATLIQITVDGGTGNDTITGG